MGDSTGDPVDGRRRAAGGRGSSRRPPRLDPADVGALEALFALDAAEPSARNVSPTAPAVAPAPEPVAPPEPPEPPVVAAPTTTSSTPPASRTGGRPLVPPTSPAPRRPQPPDRPPADPRPDLVFRAPRWHWLAFAFCAGALAAVALALASTPLPSTEDRVVGSAAVGACVVALLLALHAARSRVTLSDDGVAVRGWWTSRRRWSTVGDVGTRRQGSKHVVELRLLDGRTAVLPLPVTRRLSKAERVAADAQARLEAAPRLLG